MDTKLKNRHKLAVALIIIIILLSSCIMIGQYGQSYDESRKTEERVKEEYLQSEDFLNLFLKSSYVLYNIEEAGNFQDSSLDEDYPSLTEYFKEIYPYTEYQVQDGSGKVIGKSLTGTSEELKEADLDKYAIGIVISYDKNGTATVKTVTGDYRDGQMTELKRLISSPDSDNMYSDYAMEYNVEELSRPADRTYTYVMTKQNVNDYLEESLSYYGFAPDAIVYGISVLILLMCLAAVYFPSRPSFHTGDEMIFHAPLEAAVGVPLVAFCAIMANVDAERYTGYAGLHALGNVLRIGLLGCMLPAADKKDGHPGVCEGESPRAAALAWGERAAGTRMGLVQREDKQAVPFHG